MCLFLYFHFLSFFFFCILGGKSGIRIWYYCAARHARTWNINYPKRANLEANNVDVSSHKSALVKGGKDNHFQIWFRIKEDRRFSRHSLLSPFLQATQDTIITAELAKCCYIFSYHVSAPKSFSLRDFIIGSTCQI